MYTQINYGTIEINWDKGTITSQTHNATGHVIFEYNSHFFKISKLQFFLQMFVIFPSTPLSFFLPLNVHIVILFRFVLNVKDLQFDASKVNPSESCWHSPYFFDIRSFELHNFMMAIVGILGALGVVVLLAVYYASRIICGVCCCSKDKHAIGKEKEKPLSSSNKKKLQ